MQPSAQLIASFSCVMLLGSIFGVPITVAMLLTVNYLIYHNQYELKIYEFFYPQEQKNDWLKTLSFIKDKII